MTIESYLSGLKETLDKISMKEVQQVIEVLHTARLRGGKIFIMGNGGSASTASHFACDLGKNTRMPGWQNFKVISLTDNMAIFSALANDEGYGNVFSQQLTSLVEASDVVIGISASGKSPNVLNAIEVARQAGAITVGMTGFDGGQLGSMVDIHVHVPSDCIEHVEDIHLMLEHLISKAVKEKAQEGKPFPETGEVSC